jgi:hypothetical protein
MTLPAFSQKDFQKGQGQAIVTVLPSHPGEDVATISQQDISVKVNGKVTAVTGWTPVKGPVELVLLIDGSARTSLGQEFNDISTFVKEMPANTKMTIAYMENGRAAITGPLTLDASQVLNGLRVPSGVPGSNASPYFCLSDLAKHWPSDDTSARRAVVMVTDGVDNYERQYDPDDPYVQTAITDSVRAGLVVYSIYWRDMGRLNSTAYETSAGQNLLSQVAQATGGTSYWEGIGNPVSFAPYFKDLRRRLNHQFALSFEAPYDGKPKVENVKLEIKTKSVKVDAPQMVFVGRPAVALVE